MTTFKCRIEACENLGDTERSVTVITEAGTLERAANEAIKILTAMDWITSKTELKIADPD